MEYVTRRAALGAVCMLGLAACGGGGSETEVKVEATTKGQQLTDLKKALDSGAITQKEYEVERKKVMEK